MLGGLRRHTDVAARRRALRPARDEGFSLIEVIVSISVIAIVMSSLTSFFISSLSASSRQRGKQMAVQIADDAIERVRAVKGSSVVDGRDQTSTNQQWTQPVPGVASYLSGMQPIWDTTAAYPAGASATLPTTAQTMKINRITYSVNWYVGRCWQPADGGACGATETSGYVPLLRVLSAVTWPETHCTSGVCSFVTSTLVSDEANEPIFNANATATAPTVDNPGTLSGELAVPVSRQFTAENGAPPITWSASGLPTGLSMDSSGLVTGTPTAAGDFSVTVTATDSFELVGTAKFTWTINGPPKLSSPGDQTSGVGGSVSVKVPISGGTAPLTWSVTAPGAWGSTGLPPGLSLNASTGIISGTPTTAGSAQPVTISVTDKYDKTSSITFNWTITKPVLTSPGTQTSTVGTAVSRQLSTSGGTAPYTYSATGLPTGLSIGSSGAITGTPTRGTRYVVTLKVTDSAGQSDTATIVWNVSATTGGLRVTAPTDDRTGDTTATNVSFTATATGGSGSGYTWTGSDLPPGVTISSAGVVSGRPTAAGTYTTTLTVRDGFWNTAIMMFTWKVT